jgi:hypothetical protein
MKKNLILFFFSIFFSIFLIEIFLRIAGLYRDLTNINLEPSASIYDKPKNSIQKNKHPDLHYLNSNYFDLDGVKNNKKVRTLQKKNIIGFFGDSFIENYAVDPEFEFSNVLGMQIIDYETVNYGVGGYNAEQAFLRYLKYKNHDFKYVFYLFMPGDQESLGLVTFNQVGEYIVNKRKINPIFSTLGKLHITYFAMHIGLKIRAVIYEDLSSIDKSNYPHVLANRIARQDIQFQKTGMKNFAKLIEAFNREVVNNNAKFFIILYPEIHHINYFEETLRSTGLKVDYFTLDYSLATNKKFQFKNDDHWNEYGNLIFSKNIRYFLNKNLSINFKKPENYILIEEKIKNFYSKNKNK